jgi:KUP system potassium uptake protein
VQLGFLPRMRIVHKSGAEGQIYVPAVNRLLYLAVIGLVVGFGSAAALASAYGIAVTGTFVTTTVLFFVVVRVLWKKPLWIVLPGAAAFLVVDLAFFTANLTKVVSGGWFPLAVALIIFTLLSTWQRGRELVTAKRSAAEGLLREITIVLGDDPGMRKWRKRLFLLLSRTSKSPVDFFGLPQRRIVTMGSYIEL